MNFSRDQCTAKEKKPRGMRKSEENRALTETQLKNLPHSSHFLHGPVTKHSLAIDEALIDRTEIAAVIRHRAMVAQHKIAVRRHHNIRIRPLVGVLRWHVRLVQCLAVHIYLAAIDADVIALHPDHALDVALRRIARIAEYHDIAALDWFQPIDKLVHEDSFLILQGRHHAGALHLHRLIQEDDDEG